jgi:hypothetical protein
LNAARSSLRKFGGERAPLACRFRRPAEKLRGTDLSVWRYTQFTSKTRHSHSSNAIPAAEFLDRNAISEVPKTVCAAAVRLCELPKTVCAADSGFGDFQIVSSRPKTN